MRRNDAQLAPELVFLKPVQCRLECSEVLDAYSVGLASIRVLRCGERIVYCVDEPQISEKLLDVVSRIVRYLSVTGERRLTSKPEDARRIAVKTGIPLPVISENYPLIKYYVERVLSGYGPLYPLMRDPDVEEIAVDGPGRPASVIHRRIPVGWIDTNIVLNENELNTLVLFLARIMGKPVSIAHPYAEGLTPEGHRVALTYLREVSRHGSSIVVRKHFEKPLSIIQLIEEGVISEAASALLWFMLENGASIIIAGPTAAGKTTLLQALLGLIPSSKRIVTIEDTPEINLFDRPHWDSLVARRSYSKDIEDIDLSKLAVFALRRRPDILVIGEIRGVEAKIFLQAAATGHAAIATFHADGPYTTVDRLRSMGVEDYLMQNLWFIVTVKRLYRNGTLFVRRVVSISEFSNGEIHELMVWDPHRDTLIPEDVCSVIAKSKRVRQLSSLTGLTLSEICDELEKRIKVLKRLREEGVFEFKDVYMQIDSLNAEKTMGVLSERINTTISKVVDKR